MRPGLLSDLCSDRRAGRTGERSRRERRRFGVVGACAWWRERRRWERSDCADQRSEGVVTQGEPWRVVKS